MDSSVARGVRKPFIEHIRELRRRLLVCAGFLVVGAGIGYYLNGTLARLIQQPLGEKLYFTSPTGGFNFVFTLCLSFGILVALPCIMYQILAFLRPLLPHANRANMFWYPVCSIVLAGLGVSFAYFISLPAALHFLTNIGGGSGIQSLITTDSYFKFALTYLIGFAILFQLPLLLIIINRITPLKPGKLMKAQRYVILGSFIVAAVLTPTPDPFNQALMAGPIIALYQLSIILVWIRNMRQLKSRVPKAPPTVIVPAPAAATPLVAAIQKAARPASARRLISDVRPQRAGQQKSLQSYAVPSRPKSRPLRPITSGTSGVQWSRHLIDITNPAR